MDLSGRETDISEQWNTPASNALSLLNSESISIRLSIVCFRFKGSLDSIRAYGLWILEMFGLPSGKPRAT